MTKQLKKVRKDSLEDYYMHPKEQYFMRRSSLDLTRSLVELRKP